MLEKDNRPSSYQTKLKLVEVKSKKKTSETGRPNVTPESVALIVSVAPRKGDPGIKKNKYSQINGIYHHPKQLCLLQKYI